MPVIVVGLILLAVLVAALVGDFGLSSDEIFLLAAALGLFAIAGAVAAVPWMQERRYRQLVDRGLGISRKPRWTRLVKHRYRWVVGLVVGVPLVALLASLNKPEMPTESTTSAQSQAAASESPGTASAASAPDTLDQRSQIEAGIRAWAEAWSARRVDEYLAAYSPAFTPADRLSRKAWESARRQRIEKAREIAIGIDDLVIAPLDKSRAEAVFVQSFSARGVSERSRKTLTLELTEGRWRILREDSVPLADQATGGAAPRRSRQPSSSE